MVFYSLQEGNTMLSSQPFYLAIDDVDAIALRMGRQAWHAQDVACNHDDHTGTSRGHYITHGKREPFGYTYRLGVVAEGILCLGNTNRQFV